MKISLFKVFCLFTIMALAVSLYTVKERTVILHAAASDFNAGIRCDLEAANSPEWIDLNVSPPIDVCEVMRISKGIRADLNRVCNTPRVNRWECLSITLCTVISPILGNVEERLPKKWCYLLRYTRINNEIAETYEIAEAYEVLDAFVLMNGDIVISEGQNAEVEEALKKDLKFSSQARFSENLEYGNEWLRDL